MGPSSTVERRDLVPMACLGLLVLPLLVGAIAVLRQHWYPVSDLALIEMRVRDVGTKHTPLLGPFSRLGWAHPGPLVFWLLAPGYRLLGSSPTALLAAAALQNAAVLAAAGVVAYRLGGRSFVLVLALGLAFLCRSLGADVLVSAWNPWLALLPFALLLLLTWGLTERDFALLPWWTAVASYAVQTHVGYVPLVVALGLWAAVASSLGATVREQQGQRTLGWSIALSVLVAVLLWIGPAVEQMTSLLNLAGYQAAVAKDADTALKINISWHFFFLGSSTPPWQLEGVIRAMKRDGYDPNLTPVTIAPWSSTRT